ncbi:MAG: M15 family metallopeptidase [Bacteroidales bacterium]|jgi:D-alanyl-D-alanine dipeptidase|nr:M15 family metallopeptidase [Bacteroidales bacterium]
MKRYYIIFILGGILLFVLLGKRTNNHTEDIVSTKSEDTLLTDIITESRTPPVNYLLDSLGLVNIQDMDSTIGVQLKYATTDNFTGKILYKDFSQAYLQTDVAVMLSKAQQYLQRNYPGLSLLVYDAARPLATQKEMWDQVKDTRHHKYVATPERTSLHNYGAAVDLTISDSLFIPIDMGTEFDFFGKAASVANEPELLEQGILTEQQVQNRKLLREVMYHAGFRSISGEWWHFNACSLTEARQRYPLIEHF